MPYMPPPVRLVDPPRAEAEESPDEAADDDAAEDEATPMPAAGAADARLSANIRTAVFT